MTFQGDPITGVLLDITGVLCESSSSGDGHTISGSVEAVKLLRSAGIKVRFVTNETQKTRKSLVEKLRRLGFTLEENEVFPPALSAAEILRQRKLNPFLLVHPNCLPDFEGIGDNTETPDCVVLGDTETPNCVVLGDAVDGFTYANMNKAFRILMEKESNCLISLGKGKYYREDGKLTLDVGPFTAGLEYATQKTALICGKPSPDFFQAALDNMNVDKSEAVMVGDDIESDVGGAQKCGLKGVLVRTGKFHPSVDENHPSVKPDKIVDNLAEFVKLLLSK